jgi:hypothetical protein
MWRGQFVVVAVGLEGWVRLVVDGEAAAKELRKIEKSFRRNPAAAILHRASVKNDDTTPNTSNGIVLLAGKTTMAAARSICSKAGLLAGVSRVGVAQDIMKVCGSRMPEKHTSGS